MISLVQDFSARLDSPSWDHWLGTDELGRDVFSRILYGARTAVSVGLISTIISLTVGLIMGSLAGYLGGRVDIVVVWLTDVTRSMPALLLAIVINLTLKVPLKLGWSRYIWRPRIRFSARPCGWTYS